MTQLIGEQLTFEVLLNPSVLAAEEHRLSCQSYQILELFIAADRIGRIVRTSELADIARLYTARMVEVRRALVPKGFCIDLVERDTATGNNGYALVPLAQSTYYAKHKERLDMNSGVI